MTIDIARKYFTPSWLERHVREIAYLKMNYLHLHISDNEGFGIQSIGHPEFKSETGQLTGQQVHDLIALAARYHVVVVPEIDMPGHMKAILKDNEKYQLKNIFGKNPAVLDIKNGEAVEFAKGIIAEYLDLFTGPYWHLGVDEVLVPGTYSLYPQLGGTKDAILDFVNDIDSFVQTHDIKNRKKLRVFNDQVGQGHSVRVNPDVVVDWWMDFSPLSEWAPLTPQQLIERGYHIMNCGWWPTYYVSGDIIRPPNPDMKSAYETWSLNQFRGMTYLSGRVKFLPTRTISVDSPYNLGSTLNVWNDYDWNNQPNSKTEDEIAEAIFKPLRVVAQKTWESKPLTDSYDEFQTIIDAVGHAPKY
jgi:hexosaminidase